MLNEKVLYECSILASTWQYSSKQQQQHRPLEVKFKNFLLGCPEISSSARLYFLSILQTRGARAQQAEADLALREDGRRQ